MTILTDINDAIDVEADKRHAGKRPKPDARLLLGCSAFAALAAIKADAIEAGEYRGFPIRETSEFEGWELRS